MVVLVLVAMVAAFNRCDKGFFNRETNLRLLALINADRLLFDALILDLTCFVSQTIQM